MTVVICHHGLHEAMFDEALPRRFSLRHLESPSKASGRQAGTEMGKRMGKGWEPKKKRLKSRLEKSSAMEEDNFPAKLS